MKKINLVKIEFVALIVLILIPFISSTVNGTPGAQDLCGDNFCGPTETPASCPIDCQGTPSGQSSPQIIKLVNSSSTPLPANQSSPVQNNNSSTPSSTNQFSNNVSANQPASAGNVPTQNTSSANITIKIIIGVITLIIIGIIIYLIIRKKKNQNTEDLNSSPAVSSQ